MTVRLWLVANDLLLTYRASDPIVPAFTMLLLTTSMVCCAALTPDNEVLKDMCRSSTCYLEKFSNLRSVDGPTACEVECDLVTATKGDTRDLLVSVNSALANTRAIGQFGR